jgi:hypothetical protein
MCSTKGAAVQKFATARSFVNGRQSMPTVHTATAGLLAELDEPMVATAALRQLRAVEVLERIATPEARQWLKELAGGVPEARLPREALQCLGRLDRKPSAY